MSWSNSTIQTSMILNVCIMHLYSVAYTLWICLNLHIVNLSIIIYIYKAPKELKEFYMYVHFQLHACIETYVSRVNKTACV